MSPPQIFDPTPVLGQPAGSCSLTRGYSQPVGIGDRQVISDGQVTLNWNNFDVGSCHESYPEQLAANARLTVCGVGNGSRDGSTIAGALNASAWVDEGRVRGAVCHGAHEFSFTRTE
jgi:hypothetical protein